MKYATYGLLAAFLAQGVYAAIPDSASGWYTPPGGFTTKSRRASIISTDGSGGAADIYVDADGNMSFIDESSSTWDDIVNETTLNALQALVIAQNNKESIERMGNLLYDFTSKTGIHVTNPNTGQSFTIRFTGGTLGESGGSTIEGQSDAKDPTDNLSIGWNDIGKIEIKGWDDEGSGTMNPLAEALTKEHKNALDNYELVVRNGSHGLNYVQLGTLKTGGAPVDDCSITTNTTNGAELQGYASLYGWRGADDETLARKGADGYLEWIGSEELLDGLSLSTTDVDGKNAIEIKDTHRYAGKHAKHYFGTGADKGGSLGWHELPNVTTNVVTGDGATIASNPNIPGVTPDEGTKYLGLHGWNYGYGGIDPLFLVNMGGALDYLPFPAMTNAACACTNKWDSLAEWIENCEVGDDGLTFSDPTFDTYLYNTLGYIYSTTPANLHFDNEGDGIIASFAAPNNWADDASLDVNDLGEYQIKGFADASSCNASLVDMLSDTGTADANSHLFLAKKIDTGELHYVQVGDGMLTGGAPVDDTTITTNAAHGAVSSGVASIYGWHTAGNDTWLSKNETGHLEWRELSVPDTDDTTIATNSNNQLTIKGFTEAERNSSPYKDKNGDFVWATSSGVTNRITAGAGIILTDVGNGNVVISVDDYKTENEATAQTLMSMDVVTSVEYDETSHQLKMTKKRLYFYGDNSATPVETVVFEATSHRGEHTQQ